MLQQEEIIIDTWEVERDFRHFFITNILNRLLPKWKLRWQLREWQKYNLSLPKRDTCVYYSQEQEEYHKQLKRDSAIGIIREAVKEMESNLEKNIKVGECPYFDCKEHDGTLIVFNLYFQCHQKKPYCPASRTKSKFWGMKGYWTKDRIKKKRITRTISKEESYTTDLIGLQLEKRMRKKGKYPRSTKPKGWVKATNCVVCGKKLPPSKAWNIIYCQDGGCRESARLIKDKEELDKAKKMLKLEKYQYLDKEKYPDDKIRRIERKRFGS